MANQTSNAAKNIVFFLNSIVNHSTDYGAFLVNRQVSLVDSTGLSPFSQIPQGSQSAYNTNGPNISYLGASWNYTFYTAEVPGVVYATEPALAANTEYGFTMYQFNPFLGTRGQLVSHQVFFNTANGPLTAGTAATGWAAAIAAYTDFNVTTAVVGAALHITAVAGYPIIYLNGAYSNGIAVPSLTINTQFVVSVGQSYDMTALNQIGNTFSSYPGYVATNNYDQCLINYNDKNGNFYNIWLFVNTGDAHYGVNTVGTETLFCLSFINKIIGLGEASPTAALNQTVLSANKSI